MKNLILILLLFTGCKKSESQEVRLNKPYSIIVDGNSIVEGFPLMTNGYAKYIQQDLNIPVINMGIGGFSTKELIAIGDRIDTIQSKDSSYVLILDEGRNDIYKGCSGITAYQHYIDYCLARKQANPNIKIIVCIPTPSLYVNPAEIAILRAALIDDFTKTSDSAVYTKGNFMDYADILIDLQANPLIGYSTAYYDRLYYIDEVHMTEVGNQIRASEIEKGIKLLL